MPMNNPLLDRWNTPFETPPFHLVNPDHYKPAAVVAISEALEEVSAIAGNPETPTFENTVAALDRSGARLNR
jgi:peptidyl-dipeptidase Dcp